MVKIGRSWGKTSGGPVGLSKRASNVYKKIPGNFQCKNCRKSYQHSKFSHIIQYSIHSIYEPCFTRALYGSTGTFRVVFYGCRTLFLYLIFTRRANEDEGFGQASLRFRRQTFDVTTGVCKINEIHQRRAGQNLPASEIRKHVLK